MTASAFVTIPDCSTPLPTGETRFRAISNPSSRHGSHHTNRYEGQEARLLSAMSLRSPRRLSENVPARTSEGILEHDGDSQTSPRIPVFACGAHRTYCPGASER